MQGSLTFEVEVFTELTYKFPVKAHFFFFPQLLQRKAEFKNTVTCLDLNVQPESPY